MNIGWNIETFLSISSFLFSITISFLIIKKSWKKYGFLYLLSSITGVILCYIFIYLNLYSFPYRLFPQISKIPLTLIVSIFPFYVLVGVRYSPKSWAYKIPFYWVVVHIGVFTEAWAENQTQLIKYNASWDLWASYTWWWIFLLVFEWVGGLIIPQDLRKPLDQELLKYGKVGWFILHFILMSTIFIAGVYAGKTLL
ncbi:MAG: CBO0543 family protein [Christensenellales bacterium]